MKSFTALLLCSLPFGLQAQLNKPATNYVTISSGESEKEIIYKAAHVTPSPRQLRWQKLELTAFFHFGVNTFTDKEWGDGKEDEKVFNPTALDAKQWVKTVKEAGFKQVIITAKHHDGFCLWTSKYTAHSVKQSPWKNGKGDVVKEVSDACRELNIGFGVYLSPWDRNSALYGTEAYNDYFVNQLTELLTQYGRVDEVWFDGANGEGPNGKKQVYDFNRWYELIRRLQPTATIAIMGPDVRWVGTETGRGREMEWSVIPADLNMMAKIAGDSQKDVAFAPTGDKRENDLGSRDKIRNAHGLVWYPAETDVSIRPGWFYHTKEDSKVKTPQQLFDIYFSSVGRNGVLLLNIPPNREGRLSEYDVKNLQRFKQLMDRTFQQNLAKNAVIKCANGMNTHAMTDGKYETYFTTKGQDTTATIELTFPSAQTFNILSLQENIAVGQRIESFVLEYKEANEWKKITEGSTVGYKRLLLFNAVNAKQVRLRILSSRLNPTLSEFGLYKGD
ncbi:alpha-L-fucosidase [Hydrobacter penzbergensis]|uniref:alpha-L-fucosidase n=1 Tax=Hydrobacter penzbergensis TaxID=1235997 RepID=A0A8X8LCK7_9BACT|nr:alpha-L-fucosidase [Hydrobacter penzbergensis]SDW34046.1 alpha-L-fucosidase [Hydrobacter penzbergensis]